MSGTKTGLISHPLGSTRRVWRMLATILLIATCVGCQTVVTADREASIATVQPSAVESRLSGRTVRFFDDFHGTQIEYFAANGQAYLWYPENRGIVVGTWRVRRSPTFMSEVCFTYPPTTRNPVTGTQGGRENCTPSYFFLTTAVEFVQGDPLNLSSGQVPGILPRRSNISLADLNTSISIPN